MKLFFLKLVSLVNWYIVLIRAVITTSFVYLKWWRGINDVTTRSNSSTAEINNRPQKRRKLLLGIIFKEITYSRLLLYTSSNILVGQSLQVPFSQFRAKGTLENKIFFQVHAKDTIQQLIKTKNLFKTKLHLNRKKKLMQSLIWS